MPSDDLLQCAGPKLSRDVIASRKCANERATGQEDGNIWKHVVPPCSELPRETTNYKNKVDSQPSTVLWLFGGHCQLLSNFSSTEPSPFADAKLWPELPGMP